MDSAYSRRTFLAASAAALAAGCRGLEKDGDAMTSRIEMSVEPFGEVGDKKVDLYTFRHENGTVVKITNYGAIVTSLFLKDRTGAVADVALGCDTLADYLAGHPYFGCIAGRCANRIANGEFELEGKKYTLAKNNGENHLHGGLVGFDKHVWNATPIARGGGRGLQLAMLSKDEDEGYPGNLTATVRYLLTASGDLAIEMEATTDKTTICNLVHHTYWNLAGHASGRVFDHELELRASRYTPTGPTLVPTGEIAPVAGTPFDFTTRKPIGRDIGPLSAEQSAGHGGGYDLNYCIDGWDRALKTCAVAVDPKSGRRMEIVSDQPGIQFYTGNFLKDQKGKGGAIYQQYGGFCLETQLYPDSIHHPSFPSPILRPGEVYRHTMIHRFGVV